MSDVRPELVVFDMAGTTIHDDDAVHDQLAEALRIAGISTTRDEINAVMGIPKPVAIRTILGNRSVLGEWIPGAAVEPIYADFQRLMLEHYRTSPSVREIDGASEIFRYLHQAGIRVALDTGFSREIVDAILARLGWANSDRIDVTVASDEVANGRPFPDLIQRAMTLSGVSDPQRVAKVGDTPSDLQEGTAAGCGWVIGVTGGSHTADELSQHPHTHLIASVADLPSVF